MAAKKEVENPIKEEGSDEEKAGIDDINSINKQLQDIDGQIDIDNPKKEKDDERTIAPSNSKPKIKVLSSASIQFQSKKEEPSKS